MATLNTLRTKGGIIVTVVIGIALLAFLLGDLIGNGFLFNSNVKVGKINGKDISYMDLYSEIDYLTGINKALSGSDAVNQQQQDIIRELAWEELKREYIVYPGLKQLGIVVSNEEMLDMIYGNNISDVMINFGFFNDPQTGLYDKSLIKTFVSNLSLDPTGNMRMVWEYLQDQVKKDALISKYITVVRNMAYVTDIEASIGEKSTNTTYDAKYVAIPYETIADSLVKVSHSEIKNYYNDNLNWYRQSASRDIEYAIFEVSPSEEDYKDAEEYFNTLFTEFEKTDNIEQFVRLNSQSQFDPTYYSREQLPEDISEFVFGNNDGVYGPELRNDVYSMVRVNDRRLIPDSLSIRQIVLSPLDVDLADSLENILNDGANFEAIALGYSLNPGDPDMGTLSSDYIPSQILNPILVAGEKRIVRIDTPNGIMLLDIYKKGRNVMKAQLGIVSLEVVPSNLTQQNVYSKVSSFYTKVAGSYDKYNQVINEEDLYKRIVRVGATDNDINGLENSKEIIRWAFNAKNKEVSGIIEVDGNYVVASLADSRESGYSSIEQVSPEISRMLLKDKKADLISSRIKNLSLESICKENSVEIDEMSGVNFGTYYIPGIGGMDMKLIGAVAGGAEANTLSKPVAGNTAVYVFEVVSEEKTTDISLESEKIRQIAVKVNDIDSRFTSVLFDMGKIEDNRVKYF